MRPSSRGSIGSRDGSSEAIDPNAPAVLGGDLNVAPEDIDVWDPRACHGGTHVSEPEREAFARLYRWDGLTPTGCRHSEPGRYTWWDYRAGNFHKNFGMRIDHLLVTAALKPRVVWAEIDREARKGKPHSLGPCSTGHRHRRSWLSFRCRLGFSGKTNRRPPWTLVCH